MKKAFFIALYLFVSQVAYSQSDTTRSVLEGLSTETDTTNMMKDYMEQLSDVDLLKQAILIRRFGQNQRLTDTITGFTKRTGLNVYVKSYLKQSKLWTAMAQAINYYDSIQPPYIMYDVQLIKLDAQTYSVIIEGFTDGTTLKPDMPVLKYQQFKVPATNTEKIVVDSLIAKLKTIEQSEYDIYGQFVNFYKASDQTYGFDRYNNKFPNMLTYYQQFSQGGSPFQPWKSVELNMTDKVQAFVDSAGLGVTFKTSISSTVTSTKTPDDTLKIQFSSVGATAGQPFEIQSFYTNEKGEEQPAGLMKAIAYEKKEMNVHIINVNDNKLESFGSIAQLQNELNRIYSPAIVSFKVASTIETVEADYTTDDEEGFYANPPEEICYSLDMLEVMNVYGKKEAITLGKIYVFIVDGAGLDKNQKAIKGYAPYGNFIVFVFVDAHNDLIDLAHTIAHEIGHAAFLLPHPFPTMTSEGSSQNLMDYAGGNDLWLIQWDVLHGGNLTGIWGEDKNYIGDQWFADIDPADSRVKYTYNKITPGIARDEEVGVMLANLDELYLLKPINEVQLTFLYLKKNTDNTTEEKIKKAYWYMSENEELPDDRKNKNIIKIAKDNLESKPLTLDCRIKKKGVLKPMLNVTINLFNYENELPGIIDRFVKELAPEIDSRVTPLQTSTGNFGLDWFFIAGKPLNDRNMGFKYAGFGMSKHFQLENLLDEFFKTETSIIATEGDTNNNNNSNETNLNTIKNSYKELLILDTKLMSLFDLVTQENNVLVWKDRHGENETKINNLVDKISKVESFPHEILDKEELYKLIKEQLLIHLNMKIQ